MLLRDVPFLLLYVVLGTICWWSKDVISNVSKVTEI